MIKQNPFNVLGLLAGVAEKDLARRKAQINAYLNVGKGIAFPEDIPMAVEGLERTQESVAKALSEIDQYSKRAVHALNWFTEGGRADGPALAHLRDGDVEKARDIWYRVASAGDLTSQSISSCSNLGTLALLNGAADNDAILVGVRWKAKLFGSEHLPELLTRMSDASIAKDVNGVAAQWSEQLATWLIPTHALDKGFMERLGETFALLAEPIRSSLRKPFEQHYETEIERMVAHCQTQRKKMPSTADKAGAQLLKNGKVVLPAYRGLLGSEALGFQHAVDRIAEELLECAINHFNAHLEDDTIRTEAVRSLVNAAGAIAEGRMLVARIEDNAKTMEEYFADYAERKEYQRVKSILDAIQRQLQLFERGDQIATIELLLTNCIEPLDRLRLELGQTNVTYLNISSAVVSKAQGRLVKIVNSAQEGASRGGDHIKHLVAVLGRAKDITDRMAGMAMHPNLRSSFDSNKRILDGLVAQARAAADRPDPTMQWLKEKAIGIGLVIFIAWLFSQC